MTEQDELKALRRYAHEATKALTDLAGGGSELFDGKIGEMFKADVFLCRTKVRERHDRLHSMWANECVRRKGLEKDLEAAASDVTSDSIDRVLSKPLNEDVIDRFERAVLALDMQSDFSQDSEEREYDAAKAALKDAMR